MAELMNKIKFNKKTMLQAVDESYATSTDLADWLVKKLHYPFRQAYQITGKIVDYANSKNKSLSNMSLKELQKFDNNITSDIFRVLSPLNSMKSKNSLGGTAPETVKKSIQYADKKIFMILRLLIMMLFATFLWVVVRLVRSVCLKINLINQLLLIHAMKNVKKNLRKKKNANNQ